MIFNFSEWGRGEGGAMVNFQACLEYMGCLYGWEALGDLSANHVGAFSFLLINMRAESYLVNCKKALGDRKVVWCLSQ